jgi:putative flavoprotein involved in K+ transport
VEADTAASIVAPRGNLHQSRHYSQFFALQIKARMEGIPTEVYGLKDVHHLS